MGGRRLSAAFACHNSTRQRLVAWAESVLATSAPYLRHEEVPRVFLTMAVWIRLLALIFVGMTFTGSLAAAERAVARADCGASLGVTSAGDTDTPSTDGARHLFCQVASSILPSEIMPARPRLTPAMDSPRESPLLSRTVAPRERPPRQAA